MKTRACTLLVPLLLVASAMGDVIECENGDRYNGKVLLLNEKELKLQNDIQGNIIIPREKIVTITFRPGTKTAGAITAPSSAGKLTNAPAQLDSSAVAKVQQEFLGDANPEANQLFQEMVTGLMSGKLNVADIQGKALNTLNELKAAQKELGQNEDSEIFGNYAAILENFIKAASQATNKSALPPAFQKAPAQP